jgi:hypothetical protein
MKYLGLIMLCLFPVICGAKEIKGKVVDNGGAPVELANVMLYSLPDSAYIVGTTSNMNGEFSFGNVKQRHTYVSVSSIGYVTSIVAVADGDNPLSIVLNPATVNLGEVTVKADSRYVSGEKVVFMPSKQEKDISAEGVDLLRNMALPLIKINPIDNSVSSVTGDGVKFYIDYLPATDREVKGLLTKDVLRVEYLDTPTDPRFNGDQHIIHFVMRQYEYGGYTKLGVGQFFIDNSGKYTIDSKFVRKAMTYDLSSGYEYSNDNNVGTSSLSEYDIDGQHISRLSEALNGKEHDRSYYATLRARYKSDRAVISNTLGVQVQKTPLSEYNSSVSFTPQLYDDCSSYSLTTSRSVSPTWDGKYDIYLRNKSVFSISPYVYYVNYDDDYRYSGKSANVYNTTSETGLNTGLNLVYSKTFGRNSISCNVLNTFREHDITYGGDNEYDVNMWRYSMYARVQYNLKIAAKLSFMGYAEYAFMREKQNERFYNDHLPNIYVGLYSAINRRNSAMLGANVIWNATPISYKTDNIIRQNEIDYISGNPDIKRSLMYNIVARYIYMPIDEVSIVPICIYTHYNNATAFRYDGSVNDNDGYSMVRTYINDGMFSNLKYGCNISFNLFNRSLSLNGNAVFVTYRRSGELYNRNNTYFLADAYANYKLGNFYLGASYVMRNKNQSSTRITKGVEYYSFDAGYGKNGLAISLKLQNIFNSSYKAQESFTGVDNFEQRSVSYNRTSHRAVLLSLSYSINYGKKTQHDNGVGKTIGVGSAALK